MQMKQNYYTTINYHQKENPDKSSHQIQNNSHIEKIKTPVFMNQNNSNRNLNQETNLPNIQQGITLDKYFGSSFKIVEANFMFSKEFGHVPKNQNQIQNQSIQQYLQEKFEIDEADEDQYSESFNESHLNSRKQKNSRNIQQRKSPVKSHHNKSIINIVPSQMIKQKIFDKYKDKKNISQHNSQYQYNNQNEHFLQFNKQKQSESYKLTTFNKEKSLIQNEPYQDVEFDDSHIVLRNTSTNIFRYSNYNKSFHEKQESKQNLNKVLKTSRFKNIENTIITRNISFHKGTNTQIPKITEINSSKRIKDQKIDKKILSQKILIFNKYSKNLNFNSKENYYNNNQLLSLSNKSLKIRQIELY